MINKHPTILKQEQNFVEKKLVANRASQFKNLPAVTKNSMALSYA